MPCNGNSTGFEMKKASLLGQDLLLNGHIASNKSLLWVSASICKTDAHEPPQKEPLEARWQKCLKHELWSLRTWVWILHKFWVNLAESETFCPVTLDKFFSISTPPYPRACTERQTLPTALSAHCVCLSQGLGPCRLIPGYLKISHLRQILHSSPARSSFFLSF